VTLVSAMLVLLFGSLALLFLVPLGLLLLAIAFVVAGPVILTVGVFVAIVMLVMRKR